MVTEFQPLSPYAIKQLECRDKYYHRYVWKTKPGLRDGSAALKGTRFHDFLEKMLKVYKHTRVWCEYSRDDVLTACQDLETSEAADLRDLIKAFANAPPPWEAPPFEGGTLIHVEKEAGVNRDKKACGFWEKYPWNVVRGKLDNIVEYPSGPATFDWKTSHKLMTMEEFDFDPGYRVYAFMLACMYPDAQRVKVAFGFVRYGVWRYRSISREEAMKFGTWIGEMDRRRMVRPNPNVGPECKWCDYSYKCKAFQEIPDEAVGTELGTTDAKVVAARLQAAKAWIGKADTWLREYVDEHGPVPLPNGKEIGFVDGRSRAEVINIEALGDKLEGQWTLGEALSKTGMSKSALYALVDNDTEEGRELIQNHLRDTTGREFRVSRRRTTGG